MRKKVYTRTVGVLLSEETYGVLMDITDQLEVSISEFIRKMVEEKVNQSDFKNYHSKGEN